MDKNFAINSNKIVLTFSGIYDTIYLAEIIFYRNAGQCSRDGMINNPPFVSSKSIEGISLKYFNNTIYYAICTLNV